MIFHNRNSLNNKLFGLWLFTIGLHWSRFDIDNIFFDNLSLFSIYFIRTTTIIQVYFSMVIYLQLSLYAAFSEHGQDSQFELVPQLPWVCDPHLPILIPFPILFPIKVIYLRGIDNYLGAWYKELGSPLNNKFY